MRHQRAGQVDGELALHDRHPLGLLQRLRRQVAGPQPVSRPAGSSG
ncbi:hypothetical protein ACFSTC_57760 [Nonomuraea ferruginea]